MTLYAYAGINFSFDEGGITYIRTPYTVFTKINS